MTGAGRRDPAVAAVLLAAVATSALTALHDLDRTSPRAVDVVSSTRFVDVALLLAGVVGAVVGARVRSNGVAVAWWTSGADRVEVVARTLRAAARSALAVPCCWWLADAATTSVRRGPPLGWGGPGLVARTVAVGLLGAVLVAVLGALVGLLAGRVARAVGLVALGSLPYAAEGLDVVSTARSWAYVLSPFGAARGVVLTGTGNELEGYHVRFGVAALAAVALLAWAGGLLGAALRVPLVAPAVGRRPRPVPIGVAAVLAAGALGGLGPHALAPGVPWQLRPAWRHAEAVGRSSRQQALAWLGCRRDPDRSCRRYEVPPGLDLPDATRAVLARGRGAEAAPARFQSEPDVVSALVALPPQRSGAVVVHAVAVSLHLRPDAAGGWLVDDVSPVRAVVS